MTSKELPGHIAALLERSNRDAQGRPADSAGITWDGRDLSGEGNPLHTFDGDTGRTAEPVAQARSALVDGAATEEEFVQALAGQRLFVPVIATGSADAESGDKEADISLVTLTAPDGRSTMPVFTCVDALTQWHKDARPVAAETERVMLAALAEGASLVVVDPGWDFTYVVRRPAIEALAQAQPWTPSYVDEELASALSEVPPQCPGVEQLRIQPHPGIISWTASGTQVMGGGHGPELTISVVVAPGLDPVDQRLALAAVHAAVSDLEILRRRADSLHIELAHTAT